MSSKAILITISAFWGISVGWAGGNQPLPTDQEIGDRITNANAQSRASLPTYSVLRTYNLHSSRLSHDATMTVRVDYRGGRAERFDVVKVENASFIGKKVLNKIIESETEANKKDGEMDISNANYKFHVSGTAAQNGTLCYVVELTPKRSSKFLLQGRAWVDAAEFAIVRLEGHPAASVGFGVGKPNLVIDFQKIGEFWMAAHNRSEAHGFLFGSSVLTVDFSGYQLPAHVDLASVRRIAGQANRASVVQ